eukprot:gene9571-12892_t
MNQAKELNIVVSVLAEQVRILQVTQQKIMVKIEFYLMDYSIQVMEPSKSNQSVARIHSRTDEVHKFKYKKSKITPPRIIESDGLKLVIAEDNNDFQLIMRLFDACVNNKSNPRDFMLLSKKEDNVDNMKIANRNVNKKGPNVNNYEKQNQIKNHPTQPITPSRTVSVYHESKSISSRTPQFSTSPVDPSSEIRKNRNDYFQLQTNASDYNYKKNKSSNSTTKSSGVIFNRNYSQSPKSDHVVAALQSIENSGLNHEGISIKTYGKQKKIEEEWSSIAYHANTKTDQKSNNSELTIRSKYDHEQLQYSNNDGYSSSHKNVGNDNKYYDKNKTHNNSNYNYNSNTNNNINNNNNNKSGIKSVTVDAFARMAQASLNNPKPIAVSSHNWDDDENNEENVNLSSIQFSSQHIINKFGNAGNGDQSNDKSLESSKLSFASFFNLTKSNNADKINQSIYNHNNNSNVAVPSLPGGIRNIGNSCYMSAIVQALFAVNVISKDIVSPFWLSLSDFLNLQVNSNDSNKNNHMSSNQNIIKTLQTDDIFSSPMATNSVNVIDLEKDSSGDILEITDIQESNLTEDKYSKKSTLKEFLDILKKRKEAENTVSSTKLPTESILDKYNMFNSRSTFSSNVIDLSKLKSAVEYHSKRFRGYSQQDAHEFLSDLISTLEEEMRYKLKKFASFCQVFNNNDDHTNPSNDSINYNDTTNEINNNIKTYNINKNSNKTLNLIDDLHDSLDLFDNDNHMDKKKRLNSPSHITSSMGANNQPYPMEIIYDNNTLIDDNNDNNKYRILSPDDGITYQQSLHNNNINKNNINNLHKINIVTEEKPRNKNNNFEIESKVLTSFIPTKQHLESVVEIHFKCLSCGYTRLPKFEEYRDYSIEIEMNSEKNIKDDNIIPDCNNNIQSDMNKSHETNDTPQFHLTDLFSNFFKDETRDLICEMCQNTNAKVQISTKIKSLPSILIIHLKRFRYEASSNNFIKVAHPVSFPEYLKFDKNGSIISLDSLSKEFSSNNLIHKQPDQILLNDNNWWKEDSHLSEGKILDSNMNAPQNDVLKSNTSSHEYEYEYELVAVVRHFGKESFAGHYICDAKQANNDKDNHDQWKRFNDSVVTIIDKEKMLQDQTTPYIFFYRRK